MSSFESALALFAVNILLVAYVHSATRNTRLTYSLFYFVIGIALIAAQYKYAASTIDFSSARDCHTINNQSDSLCSTFENKMLALLSFFHFSFQPYFYHVGNSAVEHDCRITGMYLIVCLKEPPIIFMNYVSD
jgi:hypothetical protein